MSPTICFKCKFHRGAGTLWYDQRCAATGAQGVIKLDFVTGEACQPPKPYCRDINKDGDCPHYEKEGF